MLLCMLEEVNLQNLKSHISIFLVDKMPGSLMVRRMIAMHIDWGLQYVENHFQFSPSLHTSQNQNPNALLEVPIFPRRFHLT